MEDLFDVLTLCTNNKDIFERQEIAFPSRGIATSYRKPFGQRALRRECSVDLCRLEIAMV